MACGLTPLGKRKFSSFWLTDTLLVGIAKILSAEYPDWVAVHVIGLDEVDACGVFSLPWIFDDMLLNWCKVGLSQ